MYSTIIVAAGKGSRTNLTYNKVLHKINGRFLIEYTVDKFNTEEIIVVVNEKDFETVSGISFTRDVKIVIGGETRQESVYNGIVAAKYNNVLIHDGARVFVNEQTIQNVCTELLNYSAVCPVVKVVDSIKNEEGHNISRENLFAAQTPQGIKKSVYLNSFDNSKVYTDDVSVIEYAGYEVKLCDGDSSNFKVTTANDILFAEYILKEV